MTIAAGFVHSDGVLMCADTQLETWAMKTHGMKLGEFSGKWGRGVSAFAGNVAFASAAVQRLARELRIMPSDGDVLQTLERTLDRQYRKLVFSHPQSVADPNLPYQLLLAIWLANSDEVVLYSTHDASVRRIRGYHCEGIGDSLAHFLIGPVYAMGMPEREVLAVAAYALGGVKNHVPGCGGLSLFWSLRKDGSLADLSDDPAAKHIENVSRWFDFSARSFFMSHVRLDVTDRDFEGNLRNFDEQARQIWRRWQTTRNEEFSSSRLSIYHDPTGKPIPGPSQYDPSDRMP